MIQFGTNPIAWANDDDRSIGADIPTARILDEAGRQIGFDGIENGHRWPDEPEALRALLAANGLKFISGWYSTELLIRSVADEIANAQHHIAKLKHNGCKVMIVCETSNAIHGDAMKAVNDRPRLTAAEMVAFGAKLEEFAAYLTSQGLKEAPAAEANVLVAIGVLGEKEDTAGLLFSKLGMDPGVTVSKKGTVALVLKVREGGRTVGIHAFVVGGVNAERSREIHGAAGHLRRGPCELVSSAG